VPTLRGVRIVDGIFEPSLTADLAAEIGRVSLAHFDADLYESTRCALDWLTPLVGAGTLLLFDEFAGEDPAEARAFSEWCQPTGVRAVLLALFGRGPSGKGATLTDEGVVALREALDELGRVGGFGGLPYLGVVGVQTVEGDVLAQRPVEHQRVLGT